MIDRAHAMVGQRVPVVAAADRPLVDVAARAVVRIQLEPVAPVRLADGKPWTHVAAHDVVLHGGEGAALDGAAQLVQRRRPREAGREGRLAGLDQLDRPCNLVGAVGCGENLVVVLFPAEAAAQHALMHDHLDLLRRLAEEVRKVGGKGHPGE